MIHVIKADGTTEEFSDQKVLASVQRAGIPKNLQNDVLMHIKKDLYDGIPTYKIYKRILDYLIRLKNPYQEKYSLKRAIMEIGPSGFPFEVYVAEIFKSMGYSTIVGTSLRGKCVNHEVDVIAKKGEEKIFVECKYHNRPGIRSDVHVSLYTKARFDDLKERHNFSSAILVTNTKITSDALDFANCADIKVIGWNYPEGGGLRDLVEKYKLFPITQFSFASPKEKSQLLEKKIVLVKQICDNPNLLDDLDFGPYKKEHIIRESRAICSL